MILESKQKCHKMYKPKVLSPFFHVDSKLVLKYKIIFVKYDATLF